MEDRVARSAVAQHKSPSSGALQPGSFGSVLDRNIDALRKKEHQEERAASLQDRMADAITRFAGSMAFVYIHLALVAGWVAANLGIVPGVPKFDPTFVILATVASVEAIFLSTFVLISQNRMQAAADKRADLDLQISLLAEHEVTKLAALVSDIAKRLGVETEVDDELREIKRDVAPEAVLDEIDAAKP
jgi:uncharacterized membrane protein